MPSPSIAACRAALAQLRDAGDAAAVRAANAALETAFAALRRETRSGGGDDARDALRQLSVEMDAGHRRINVVAAMLANRLTMLMALRGTPNDQTYGPRRQR